MRFRLSQVIAIATGIVIVDLLTVGALAAPKAIRQLFARRDCGCGGMKEVKGSVIDVSPAVADPFETYKLLN